MESSYRIVPLIIACVLFMEMVDATALSTTLSSIARDLAVSPLTLPLAITAYVLSLALFIPVSGWMADRIGAKRVFGTAILVFLDGSIASGLSGEPLGIDRDPRAAGQRRRPDDSGRAAYSAALGAARTPCRGHMAWLGIPALLGPVMGPPLGGLLVDIASWRWIFWINVPIGLLGLFAVWRFVPSIRRQAKRPFDLLFLVLGAGLLCLMAGLELADGQLASPRVAVAALVPSLMF